MVDIADYETRGDLDAPFVLTKKAERAQQEREQIRAHAKELVDQLPPLSAGQCEQIGRILSTAPRAEQMTWRLRLFCGHTVVRSAHASHRTIHGAFMGGVSCPECGLDPATIIDGEAIGLVESSPLAVTAKSVRSGKPTKAELEARVRELEAEVERLHGASDAAE